MAEFTGPFTEADFIAGSVVQFTDVGTVLQDHEGAALCSGRINGAAIPELDGWLVPVWAERDHGREATTIYVASTNIVSIAHPQAEKPRPVPPSMRSPRTQATPITEPAVFDDDEVAMLSIAVLQAVRGATFRRDLDPLDVDLTEVQVEPATMRTAVFVRLSDDRAFRLVIDPVPNR